jgi:hypothetical protein
MGVESFDPPFKRPAADHSDACAKRVSRTKAESKLERMPLSIEHPSIVNLLIFGSGLPHIHHKHLPTVTT